MSNVLVISDMQVPFHHRDALAFLKAVRNKYKTDKVVCIGDEVDNCALSDYDHDPDGMSAGDELTKAIALLKPFYATFPKVLVCESNHTSRPLRKALRNGIPRAILKSYNEFLHAPAGWQWSESWEVDGIIYEHGDRMRGEGGGAVTDLPLSNMQSTVFGHFHTNAGVHYIANKKALVFGMNVGCLLDIKQYAFAYAKKMKNRPVLGCGVVLNGQPIVVPMVLSSNGRWVGKL